MPIRRRSDVLSSVVAALNYAQITLGEYPLLLHYDNANEFVSLVEIHGHVLNASCECPNEKWSKCPMRRS